MKGSFYIPGQGWLYGISAGRKLLVLVVLGAVLMLVHRLSILTLSLLAVAALMYQSGLSFQRLWSQLKLIVWFLLLLCIYSAWVQSPEVALEMLLRLSSLILAALLVSMTTPITQMMDVVVWLLKPFERLGWVNTQKVSLALGLTLRLIPELSVQWDDIREAQAARGIEPGVMTMLFPMLVRTLRRAEELSEAIDARSMNE
jgi:biotin transport system permease protein